MTKITERFVSLTAAMSILGFVTCLSPAPVLPAEGDQILTTDHLVSHTSTVPANAGERVELFVRERIEGDAECDEEGHHRHVVLMLQGATQPTIPIFDLHQFENYSWMAFLAHAGFDVFAMDLTGSACHPDRRWTMHATLRKVSSGRFSFPLLYRALAPPAIHSS